MARVDVYRAQVASVALEAVEAHYVHGAAGNHPSVCDGHPARDIRLTMAQDRFAATATAGIRVHTAVCISDQTVYCMGRPGHPDVARLANLPADAMRTPARLQELAESGGRYKWPRTAGGHPGTPAFGEACGDKRHFDCIGFVSWVIWRIFHTQTIRDIAACQQYAIRETRLHPDLAVGQAIYQAGDILIFSVSHIGFALNAHEMVEAQGETLGLVRSPVRRGITSLLRPTNDLLSGIWNIQG